MSLPITRRQTLGWLAAGAVAGTLRPRVARAGSSPVDFRVESIRTISQQPALYHGWPTLARRQTGELLLVCSGGREAHVCPFGRVELMRSLDNGATWTFPRVLCDNAIDDRDAGIVETTSGTLLATTFTSLAFEPGLKNAEKSGSWSDAKLARWQACRDRLSEPDRKTQLGVWMLRSTDNGQSWSAPYRCLVNSPHGPFALSDGRLLYAGKALWTDDNRVGVCESTDDGQTWKWLASIPTRSGDNHTNYHELHGVEAADGRIVVHIRNHNPTNNREILQTVSDDGGKTWSEPAATGVWGLPSHLLRLRDDSLLMSYGHRRAPLGNQARLSGDGGRSWSEPLILDGAAKSGDLGYPSTVEIGDGHLLTAWYEVVTGSSNAVLRLAEWRLG